MLGTIIDVKYNIKTKEALFQTKIKVCFTLLPLKVYKESPGIFLDRLISIHPDPPSDPPSVSKIIGVFNGNAYYEDPTKQLREYQ